VPLTLSDIFEQMRFNQATAAKSTILFFLFASSTLT
jgi:hypothetical protein